LDTDSVGQGTPEDQNRKEKAVASDDMYIRLRGRYAKFLAGEITVEDLDDDELAQGRLKSSDGTFRGRPPAVVPGEMVQAMRREWLKRANNSLAEALMGAGLGTIKDLAANAVDESVRLRAADLIVQRTMGKVPDKIEIAAEDPVDTLFRKILNDPFGLEQGGVHEPSAEEREMLG
jgi:hypothetical protein